MAKVAHSTFLNGQWHKQFFKPAKRHADVILPHGANGPAVDIITTKVLTLIRDLDRS